MGIVLNKLCFSYGERRILSEVDLHIETGEHIGIVGVSGCGKSTLLKILSGLYAPKSGTVAVNGAQGLEAIRRNVALVTQNAMLFPASILENIHCGHPMDPETLEEACRAAQLSDWVASLPEGLHTFVGERGSRVSGGQAQRIAIARAIAKNAPVVLLDEATSALDSETGQAVLKALENLTKGKTVVSVSHRPEALHDCGRVFRLREGALYAEKDL